jgi:hypothetical protein
MKTSTLFSIVASCALLIQTGCSTTLYVTIGNGTDEKITVKSMQSEQEAVISPKQFGKISHSSGDLLVTKADKTSFVFSGIEVAEFGMDQKYYDPKDTPFGAYRFDLNLLLQTNMQLYVLLPNRRTVDDSVKQPKGYPKSATVRGTSQ